ncbi:hypothetical protein [Sphingomonas jatrophae]|uniref:Uncharacterized protein n=1 Tax=Sphingomonas jatrophae TaxID=1166337 RepID=A0A1I6JNR1_9SPHN|nr:hypothetical protein [Sphingomonas jatrophae]SFR80597.1 hypothetical protein SAMN05192580_0596 [Sphingomonas jatrophae]
MSDQEQNRGGRPGAQAKGGVDPQAGDPDTPLAARERAEAEDRAMRDAGFGDDKGASIDRD